MQSCLLDVFVVRLEHFTILRSFFSLWDPDLSSRVGSGSHIIRWTVESLRCDDHDLIYTSVLNLSGLAAVSPAKH